MGRLIRLLSTLFLVLIELVGPRLYNRVIHNKLQYNVMPVDTDDTDSNNRTVIKVDEEFMLAENKSSSDNLDVFGVFKIVLDEE